MEAYLGQQLNFWSIQPKSRKLKLQNVYMRLTTNIKEQVK